MKLIDLIRLSNARFYALEIYGSNGERCELEIDTELGTDKMLMARYAQAEVARFQPIILNSDYAPALEVQLYV